jgi:predicted MFS family arabinose efflux permease
MSSFETNQHGEAFTKEPAERVTAPGSAGGRRIAGESIPFIAGLLGMQFLGSWPINVAPLINGSLVDTRDMAISTVGIVASAELLGLALTLVCGPIFLHRWQSRAIGLVGLIVAVLANLVSIPLSDPVPLSLARLCAGVGCGLAVTAGAAAIATARRVDQTGALVTIIISIAVAAGLVLASSISVEHGASGLFATCAALSAVAFVLATQLPITGGIRDVPAFRFLAPLRSPVVLASMASLGGATAVWSFSERIGVAVGLTVSEVGQVIALTTVPGILGGVAAFVCAGRGLERRMAIIGTLLFGLACTAMPFATTPSFFIAALIMVTFFFVFAQPFLTAIAVSVDQSGALVASMVGWSSIAAAALPAIAGAVIETWGIVALAIFPLLGAALALVALFLVPPPRAAATA